MSRLRLYFLLSAALKCSWTIGVPAAAQPPNLIYQSRERGKYYEGIRTQPSTTLKLDLIAAMVEYAEKESNSGPPADFRAAFHLPDRTEKVGLTIRELEPRYYYWLENEGNFGCSGQLCKFDWPTKVVVRSLNWDGDGPLRLEDLGAVARFRTATPDALEEVAPVALYYTNPPATFERYRFWFLPNEQMRLQFQVVSDDRRPAGIPQTFPSVLAMVPHRYIWDAGTSPDGWYRVIITCYTGKERLERQVRFFHKRRLDK